MIITPDFVMLNFPKTGTTFARSVIKQIYKDKYIELIVNATWNTMNPNHQSQHGRYFQIPVEHKDKKVLSITRHPFDRYVSLYFFKWHAGHPPAPLETLTSLYPDFPNMSFPDFLDMMERFYKSKILERYDIQNTNIGLNTLQFTEFYSIDPKQSFKNLIISDMELNDIIPDNIFFIKQENLRNELHSFLSSFNISRTMLDIIFSEPELNISRHTENEKWQNFWSIELLKEYREKEKKLFTKFPEYLL